MQLDQTTAVRLKYVLLAVGLSYIFILIASIIKRLTMTKDAKPLNKYFSGTLLFFLTLSFIGVGLATISSTVGFVRLHSTILQIQKDGESMPSSYPDGKYYYGYQNLMDDLVKLTNDLKQKCQTADELENMRFSQQFRENVGELEQRYRWTVEKDFMSLKASVFDLTGGCSSDEKKAIAKSIETEDHLSYIQVRFRNVIFTVGNKISPLLVGSIVGTPLACLFFLYTLFKFKKTYTQMADDTVKENSYLLWRSHFSLFIALVCIVAFSVGLIVSLAVSNAAINTKEIYSNRGPDVLLKESILPQTSSVRLAKIGKLAEQYTSVLNSKEYEYSYENRRIQEVDEHADVSDVAVAFQKLSSFIKLQDSIDTLVKWISDSIKGSSVKPLLLSQMDQMSDVFDSSIGKGCLVGLFASLLTFVVQFIQIAWVL